MPNYKLFLSDAKIETLHEWRQAINYYRLTLNQKLFLSDTKSEILQDWRHTINHSSMTPYQKSFMRDAKSEIVLDNAISEILYERRQIRNRSWAMPNQKSFMRDRQHTINLSEVTSQITLKITIEWSHTRNHSRMPPHLYRQTITNDLNAETLQLVLIKEHNILILILIYRSKNITFRFWIVKSMWCDIGRYSCGVTYQIRLQLYKM